MSLHVGDCMWRRGLRGNNATCSALSWLSVTFPTTHKQIGSFWCWFLEGSFVYILGLCGSLQWTLLWGWEFVLLMQPPQVFTVRGFETLFPCIGITGCVICLNPMVFLPVYPHANIGPCGLPPTALPCVLSPQPPVSVPPTSLNECFFFNFLVVGLPYSLIFWLFLLFFFSNLLSFLQLYEEAKYIYLCLHLSQKSRSLFSKEPLLQGIWVHVFGGMKWSAHCMTSMGNKGHIESIDLLHMLVCGH